MTRGQTDKAYVKRSRIAAQRNYLKESLAVSWVVQKHPDIWAAIEAEAEKKFPLIGKRRQAQLPKSLSGNGAKP